MLNAVSLKIFSFHWINPRPIQSKSCNVSVLYVVCCCVIRCNFVQRCSSVEGVGCSAVGQVHDEEGGLRWGRSMESIVFHGEVGPRWLGCSAVGQVHGEYGFPQWRRSSVSKVFRGVNFWLPFFNQRYYPHTLKDSVSPVCWIFNSTVINGMEITDIYTTAIKPEGCLETPTLAIDFAQGWLS